MKYRRFEELPVWQDSAELARRVLEFTSLDPLRRHPGLRDQLERAALSISNNIAEGFERGTNNELLAFLYIARGSAGEVRSMLCLLERIPLFQQLNRDIKLLKQKAERCSRQLKAWAQSLQNSEFKSERHVNKKTKRAGQAARERD